MQKYLEAAKSYTPFILLIIIWWFAAFAPSNQSTDQSLPIGMHFTADNPSTHNNYDTKLSSFNRNEIKQALAGDFPLMSKLIADWDIDAQLLEIKRFPGIKRLPNGDLLRSQTLIRLINNDTHNSDSPPPPANRSVIIDDAGSHINLNGSYHRFIPQTYAAASFLLALVPTDQIVALPPLLREQTQIHPKELTEKIPLDIDRRNSEKLFLAKPDIAFVAHYSQPATIQALANQGITLYMMKDMVSIETICHELLNIGTIVQRPLQADLMRLFIEAAFLAMDNRLILIRNRYVQREIPEPKFMMLSYHKNFSVPTNRTLTGQILSRMAPFDLSLDYSLANKSLGGWSTPIDKEKLLNIDPDILIIATENGEGIAREFQNDAALQKLRAVKNNRLFLVDEAIQNSPSQYAVLAYFDLINALESRP